jgi:Papain fold toxin 1, glutamine deamidase
MRQLFSWHRVELVVLTVVWAAALVTVGVGQSRSSGNGQGPFRDEFSTGDSLPGQVGGGPCEDTSRYDRQYRTKAVRIQLDKIVPYKGLFFRCAVDKCAPNETAICWPKPDWKERLNGPPGSDSFSTQGIPGKVDGGPCEDTSNWDRQFGVRPIRMLVGMIGEFQDLFFRCSADRCATNVTALCWPRPDWPTVLSEKQRRETPVDDPNDPHSPNYNPAPGTAYDPCANPRVPPECKEPRGRKPPLKGGVSTGRTPTGRTPTGDTPTGNTPSGGTPTGETPQGRTPSGNRPRTPPPGTPPNNGRPGGPPRRPPYQGRIEENVERICNLQQLAVWLFRRYGTDRAIATVQVTNAARPTYLVMLSGMEFDRTRQANGPFQAFIAWANIQALDIYRLAVLEAVANLPAGADIILAGHSQGGMEAQDLVPTLFQQGHRVPQVISYGAPITVDRTAGTSYLHVRAPDDTIIGLDRRFNLNEREVIFSNRGVGIPHFSYPKPESGLDLFRVPAVSSLRTPCYEIDINTLEEFEAPNLFRRFFGAPHPWQTSRTPANPGRDRLPIDHEMNCFWVALAQDQSWARGMPFPAQCEMKPMKSGDIQRVLQRWYGDKPINDRHGPTPQHAQERQRAGYPVPYTNRDKVERALAAPGSRGLVFAWDAHAPQKIGHVFNVRNTNGTIEYYDGQQGTDASFWFAPGMSFSFYRTN